MLNPTVPRVLVEPESAIIDVARQISLLGFAPGESVTLIATLRQNDGSTWRREAVFVADPEGSVDLTTAAPVSGTYGAASPMGVVWSMRQTGEALPPGTPFDQTAPLTVHLSAHAASGRAEGRFEQLFLAPGIDVRPIHEDGIVGTLFTAPEPGPHGLVIVLRRSGGGLLEARASLFAAYGY